MVESGLEWQVLMTLKWENYPARPASRSADENPSFATKAPRQNAWRAGKAQRNKERKSEVLTHLGVFCARGA